MRVVSQNDDGNAVVEMTTDEAMLMGCLEDAWKRAVRPPGEQGPPGSLWYHNVQLDDALKAVAAWAELSARINGLRLVLNDLDGIMREPPKLYDIWAARAWLLRIFWLFAGLCIGLRLGAAL